MSFEKKKEKDAMKKSSKQDNTGKKKCRNQSVSG